MSIARGPVGWWRFDGNLLDASGNGNHGTVGAGSAAYAAGKYGRAWNNNSTRFIDLPAGNSVLGSTVTNLTISAWVKVDDIAAETLQRFVSFSSATTGGATAFALRKDGTKITTIGPSSTIYYNGDLYANQDITQGEWFHFAAVWSGVSQEVSNYPGAIGVYRFSDNQHLRGQIDNVMIHTRALSPSEIKTLHALGSPI